jgi:hypothetical protein
LNVLGAAEDKARGDAFAVRRLLVHLQRADKRGPATVFELRRPK